MLSRLIPDARPHPVGSPQNAKLRDIIVTTLREAGYAPQVRAAFRCETGGNCARVENIVAVRAGGTSGQAVLVSAHYDSVDAGPGTSDDVVGVTILLDLARSLAQAPASRNDIVFLLSDAEESGLHGAHAFADSAPEMARIRAVVNVEARGAAGPSLMFETGPGNARLIDLYQRNVARPVTNSLIYEVYKALPNDTDFSVYRQRGIGGFNFAFVGSASLYHSARDLPKNLDIDTFQHHGDHVFASVYALANADLGALHSTSDASYFDLFSHRLFVWPSAWDAPIAVLALAAIVLLALMGRRRKRGGWWALLALILMPFLLFGIGGLAAYPLGVWPGVQGIDHPAPWPGRIALILIAILVPLLMARWLRGRVDWRMHLWTVWPAIAILATLAALRVPGAAYALTWPCFAFAIVVVMLWRKPQGLALAASVGVVLAALFWIGHFLILEAMFGFAQSGLRIVFLTIFSWTLLPLFAASMTADERRPRNALLLCTALMLTAIATGYSMPAYTPQRPRGVNVEYLDNRSTRPYWRIDTMGPADEAYLRKIGMPQTTTHYRSLGVFPEESRLKPATRLPINAPSFTKLSETMRGTDRVISGEIRGTSVNGSLRLAVARNAQLKSLRVGGEDVWTMKTLSDHQPRSMRINGVGVDPVAIELIVPGNARAEIMLTERSPLPDTPESRAILNARPVDAAPVHGGDAAVVTVPLQL